MSKPFFLCGDIHGQFGQLGYILSNFSDCNFLVIGDCGVGLQQPKTESYRLSVLNEICVENNITLLFGRGNHDRKIDFDNRFLKSNIQAIADYTYFEEKKMLWIGGGISIDRKIRKENVEWWSDEKIDFRYDFPEEVENLVTHVPPNWVGPNGMNKSIANFAEKDKTLWAELQEERAAVDKLFEAYKPKRSYHGHMHCSETGSFGGCLSKILNIFEIVEII